MLGLHGLMWIAPQMKPIISLKELEQWFIRLCLIFLVLRVQLVTSQTMECCYIWWCCINKDILADLLLPYAMEVNKCWTDLKYLALPALSIDLIWASVAYLLLQIRLARQSWTGLLRTYDWSLHCPGLLSGISNVTRISEMECPRHLIPTIMPSLIIHVDLA